MLPYVDARFVGVSQSQFGRGPTKGWCPGVLDPMETGDGWLLRLRVPGGTITADGLRIVSGVAERYGSGLVDITARANLQIRGVVLDSIRAAVDRLVDAGLALADAAVDARRAVVASPLTGHDPASVCDAGPVVADIVTRLVAELDGTLPSKFGVVVDDGGSWPLGDVDGDVRVQASAAGWVVHVRDAASFGPISDPAEAVLGAARLCIARGARMDRVAAVIPADLAIAQPARTLGLGRHRDADRCNLVAAPFLGRLDAETLADIADVAERCRAAVRLTPDHSIALCGIAADDAPAGLAAMRGLGLVVDADDGRAMVSACVGTRGCASAHADTWAAAVQLAARSPMSRAHLSGCAKGCGAPSRVAHLVADTNGDFR